MLRQLDVRLIINMRIERRPHPDGHEPPIKVLWLPTIDSPLFPIPIRLLNRGTRAALETFQHGGKVYTHCAKGIHRGVAMGAAILIALGHSPDDAMRLISEKRLVADPYVWYIRHRIQRFAKYWGNSSGVEITVS
ncbi:MAG: dual specificity protein phosphatase family protein [Anaerolineales bacterium]|nr:dual specificity protein phosphatase family protein [Anaerolineales bacterium]